MTTAGESRQAPMHVIAYDDRGIAWTEAEATAPIVPSSVLAGESRPTHAPNGPLWQVCPVCKGTGLVSRPPGVSGDQQTFVSDSAGPWACRTCSCGNRFDGDNLCMVSACQWEDIQPDANGESCKYGDPTCPCPDHEPCCEYGPPGHTEQEHHNVSPCYDNGCPFEHPRGGPFPHPCDGDQSNASATVTVTTRTCPIPRTPTKRIDHERT